MPRGASSRERARSYGEQIKGRGVVSARGGSSASAADVDAIRQLIDAEARRALERREGEEERRRIEAKREAVCREREEAAKARDALDLRKERVVAQLERERDDLVRALDALDDRLVGPEGASDELRDRRAAAANRLATLEDKIASGRVLSSEEERALRELEDRLDSLETEAEYIAAAHGDLASPRAGSGDGETAKDTASGLSPGASARVSRFASAEACAAVAVALERVVAAHTREREKDAKAAELEMQLGDAQSAIEEMENATRMREMDYDRRVTELRREHSEKEAYLMKLSERVAAQVDALERAGGPTAAAATTKEARARARTRSRARRSRPRARRVRGCRTSQPSRRRVDGGDARGQVAEQTTQTTRQSVVGRARGTRGGGGETRGTPREQRQSRARASGTGGAPLDGSPERSTRRSVDVVHRLARALADASRTAEASGDARGWGGRCGSRVSVEGTRRVVGGG